MRGSRPETALLQSIERDGIIRRGERVLVALSGGADSVALAALLAHAAEPLGLQLSFGHVNHGLRSSAWQDECVALRVAATFGVRVLVEQIRTQGTGEAELREARYAALERMARLTDAQAVALGHHAQDQAETVVMALLRGSGPEGLGGMRARRPLAAGIDLVRPLLRIMPEELRYYCHVHALPYAVDPSNADGTVRRNAVRATLEALRPHFPALDAAVARAAELVSAERGGDTRAGLRRDVRAVLEEHDNLRDVDFLHIESVVRALESGASGRFHMKAGLALRLERGRIATVERD